MVNRRRQHPSFEQKFRSLESDLKNRLSKVTSPLTLGIAALVIAEDKFGIEWLSASDIVRGLESAGTHLNQERLIKALARAGDQVARRNFDGATEYRPMISARRTVASLLEVGNVGVAYIEEGRPRTARRNLGEILAALGGSVRICDPYYGVRTLDALELLPDAIVVRFLTANTNESGRRLNGALADFRRERPNVEMRRITSGSVPHDRYMVNPEVLIMIGHGLKDIGNRESFVIVLDRSVAADLIDELTASFDTRWSAATPL